MLLLLLYLLQVPPLDAVAAASTDPLTWLANLGRAGIVIVLLVTGQLRTKAEVTGLTAQNEGQAKLIEGFQLQLTEHTLPALAKFVEVFDANNHHMEDLVEQVRRTQDEVRDVSRALNELTRNQQQTRRD